MGSVKGGPRPPNTTAYFVALAGILVLLVLLCCYFFYFCIKKVKELTGEDSPLNQPEVTSPRRTNYPVQQGVRDSATAMAKMCKQLPATGKGGTVFPAASSPAATHTDTGTQREEAVEALPVTVNLTVPEAAQIDVHDKLPVAPSALQVDTAAATFKGKGGTVFPAASSPAATHTDTGTQREETVEALPMTVNPTVPEAAQIDVHDKLPVAPSALQADTAAAS